MTLAEGEGGTEVDLGEGSEEPEPTPGEAITVNELYRLAETVTGKDKLVIDAENNRTLEAVVVTDVDGGNVSANNLMVMTEGATQAKNGILLFSSGQYTNPKDPAFPFKSGDKVRCSHVADGRSNRQGATHPCPAHIDRQSDRLSGHARHGQERHFARNGR